jgi:hypothetical protein
VTRASLVASVVLAAGLAGCTRTSELVAAQAMACAAPGPLVHLGGTGVAACAGAIAAQAGRFALCSCNDVFVPGSLIVNSVGAPSRSGGPTSGGSSPWPGGGPMDGLLPKTFFTAVGIDDGILQTGGHADVPGSLIIAGSGDVKVGTQGHVLGNAHLAGNLRPSTFYWISGDAYVAGDVAGQIVVGQTLHAPAASMVTSSVQAHATVREAVTVAPPCNCAAGPAFDVAAAVEARRATNGNAFLPFSPNLLDDLQTAQTLDLPCGEYYLDTIRTEAAGALELRVHGHVGVFVAGDVSLGSTLIVTLDPGATLDLVVAGSLLTTGRVFGSPMKPAGTRLWVGGQTIGLPNQIQFGAFVYAPGAVFSAGVGLVFSGSLFVGNLSVDGDARIGYDPAITQAGDECGVTAPAPVQ